MLEDEEAGKDLAPQSPTGGNGAWKPFTSESGREAALKRVEYQRELKRRAREVQAHKAAEGVSDAVDLQLRMIRQALEGQELTAEELKVQKAGLDAAEKMLDRFMGRPTSKTQFEDLTQEADEAEVLDAEWTVDDGEQSSEEPERESS